MAAVYFLIPDFEFGHMTSFEQQNETEWVFLSWA